MQFGVSLFCVCADESHLFDIEDELMDVADRWKRIGRALRLRPPTLNQIEADQRNVADRLSAVLENWVKKNYDVERAGEPTWTLLVRAVSHPAGGGDCALALKIATKYGGNISVHTTFHIVITPLFSCVCVCVW